MLLWCLGFFKKSREEFHASIASENHKLLKYQSKLETKFRKRYLYLSLHETLIKLVEDNELELANSNVNLELVTESISGSKFKPMVPVNDGRSWVTWVRGISLLDWDHSWTSVWSMAGRTKLLNTYHWCHQKRKRDMLDSSLINDQIWLE